MIVMLLLVNSKKMIHKYMSNDYMKMKQYLSSMKSERRELRKIINVKQEDIRMMISIYELTKKIVKAITLDDVLKLCVDFFDKYFVFNSYVIFKYNIKDNEYCALNMYGVSNLDWEKIQSVIKNMDWIEGEDLLENVLNTSSDKWNDLSGFFSDYVKSFMIKRLISSTNEVYAAILFSNRAEYFQKYILNIWKYF
jgi:hypothetical protein